MSQSFVESQMNRNSRSLLLLGGGLLAAALLAGALSARYVRNSFSGPYPITREALIEVTDPDKLSDYYVTVQGDEIFNTGIEYTVRNSRSGVERTEAEYHVITLDEKILVVRLSPDADTDSAEHTGWLMPLTADEQREVVADVESQAPSTVGNILPVKLEAAADNGGVYVLIGAIVIAALAGLFALSRWMRARSVALHPLMRDLARYGDAQQMLAGINSEITPATKGPNILTPHWLFKNTPFAQSIRRLDDVAWAHRMTVSRKTYGITVGKTHWVHVYDRVGGKIEFAFDKNESQADAFLRQMLDHAPWIIGGYSAELESGWKKDRTGFLAAVDDRMKRHRAAQA